MAIHKRQRQFQKLFGEIIIETIPLKFVRDITCNLDNGTTIVIGKDEIRRSSEKFNSVEEYIQSLEFFSILSDLRIRPDFSKVEKDIESQLSEIFSGTTDDKGDSGM
jgi:hypothetical protein